MKISLVHSSHKNRSIPATMVVVMVKTLLLFNFFKLWGTTVYVPDPFKQSLNHTVKIVTATIPYHEFIN